MKVCEVFLWLILATMLCVLFYPPTTCKGDVQITKYTKIITTEDCYKVSDEILGRVDNCIEEIARQLSVTLPDRRPLMIIYVLPNKLYVQAICKGDDVLACTFMPNVKNSELIPLLYFSIETYGNNILTHELIHTIFHYRYPELSSDDFTHEKLAYGLYDRLCP
jgi:hypothetical protein